MQGFQLHTNRAEFSEKAKEGLVSFLSRNVYLRPELYDALFDKTQQLYNLYFHYSYPDKEIIFSAGSAKRSNIEEFQKILIRTGLELLPEIKEIRDGGNNVVYRLEIALSPNDFIEYLNKINPQPSLQKTLLSNTIRLEADQLHEQEEARLSVQVHSQERYVDIYYPTEQAARQKLGELRRRDIFRYAPELQKAVGDKKRTFISTSESQDGTFFLRIPIVLEGVAAASDVPKQAQREINRHFRRYRDILNGLGGGCKDNPTVEQTDLDLIRDTFGALHDEYIRRDAQFDDPHLPTHPNTTGRKSSTEQRNK